jgi:hypothetical protein
MNYHVASLGAGTNIEDEKRIDDIRRQLDDAISGMDPAQPVRTTPRLPSPDRAQELLRGIGRNRGGR